MKVRFTLTNNKPLTTCVSKSTYDYIYNRWKAGQDVELGHKRTILNSEIEEIEKRIQKIYEDYADELKAELKDLGVEYE